jgi:hypothetical protein
MTQPAYRFEFGPTVPTVEAEMSLHLALIAVEGLFGRPAVRLDARYRLLEPERAIAVDCSSPVGAALVRVFTALLIKEFGDNAFDVRRVARVGEVREVAESPARDREDSDAETANGAEALAAA